MLRIFIGYDHRQPVAYNVLQQSILTRSSVPVAITPLVLRQLPLKREGLTPFTYSRFLVPYLCDYKGWALFLDIDILVGKDIKGLFELKDDKYAVMVSKNKISYEWASVMLFNCEKCKILTPEYVETAKSLHGIEWAKQEEIGDLPPEWNHLVGYDEPRKDAKLVHYTQGIPCFEETATSEYAEEWINEHKYLNSTVPWADLMGNSKHAATLNGKPIPRFVADKLIKEGKACAA
jgi:hypothetical protein